MFKRDLDLDHEWIKLLGKIHQTVGKKPNDIKSVLFLIGVQELGKGALTFSKEEKQDLIHIAICKVLSLSGFYSLEGVDDAGWPHWKLEKELPKFDLFEQEKILKMNIIDYFKNEIQL